MSEGKDIDKQVKHEMTERNWLFLKLLEEGKSVRDAYKEAGYKGEYHNTPYLFYNKLKKKLEAIYDSDNTDSLRLKMRVKKIIDMPIEQKPLRPEVHLKAIETLDKLSNKEKKEAKVISPFIVFKHEDGKITASEGKVINAETVDAEVSE